MKGRKLWIGLGVAALVGLGCWLGWRWYTTPTLPDIPLQGAPQQIVAVIDKAREEVRRHPRAGVAWGNLAMTLSANGYSEPALACFTNAERFDPKNPQWPYLHALQLGMLNNTEQALVFLRRSLPLARNRDERAAILLRLILILSDYRDGEEVDRYLRELREIEPEHPRVYYASGLVAIARNERAAAREHLGTLLDNPFARKRAYTLLATLTDGNQQLARTYLEQANKLPPDAPWPNSFEEELGRRKVVVLSPMDQYLQLKREGRSAEALVVLQQLVRESPNEELCLTLGITLLMGGRAEESITAFRQALGFNPQNAKAYLFLSEAFLNLGERQLRQPSGPESADEWFRQALAAADQALAIQRNLGFAHLIRGRVLKHLGRKDEAIQSFREAVECRMEAAETHLALGEALAEAGQFREAIESLKHAVELADPNDSRPRAALEKWQPKAKGITWQWFRTKFD